MKERVPVRSDTRRLVPGVAALALALVGLAAAQEGNPLDKAGKRLPEPEPWTGGYVDEAEGVAFLALAGGAPGTFEGFVATREARDEMEARGTVEELRARNARAYRFQGTFRGASGQEFPFTAELAGDALTFTTGSTTYHMERMPDAPRTREELERGPPGGPAGRATGNEAAAIGALKTICTSQSLFRESDRERDGNLDYGTLAELGQTDLIDAVLASGTKHGYVFECRPAPATPEFLWAATANPVEPGVTGTRYFFMNHAGVVYYSTRQPFAIHETCQPPEGATPVGMDEGRDVQGSAGGPLEVGGQVRASLASGDAVDYTVTIVASGRYVFDTLGSDFDTVLTLLDAAGSQLARDDDGGPQQTSRIVFDLAPGTYSLRVSGFGSRSGTYVVRAGRGAPPPPPSSSPQALTLDAPARGVLAGGATADLTFEVAASGRYTIHTEGSTFDTVLSLRRPPMPSGPLVAEDDDGGPNQTSVVVTDLEPGTYHVQIRGFGGQGGDWVCSAARAGSSAQPVPQVLTLDAPARGVLEAGARVDLTFEVRAAGRYTLHTEGSRFDTVLAVRRLPMPSGALVAEDDDGGPEQTSRLVLDLEPGTYHVQVRGFAGRAGAWVCTVTGGPGGGPGRDGGARGDGAPGTGARPPVDLSHVRVGQRYRYWIQGGVEQEWIVDEVTPEHVRYTISTFMGGNPIGDPSAQLWQVPAVVTGDAPPAPPGAGAQTRRERVTVSGITFDCLVTTSGTAATWTPMSGDVVTFPGIVRSLNGQDVVMELRSITEPGSSPPPPPGGRR